MEESQTSKECCKCNPSVTDLVVNRRFWVKRKANSGEVVVLPSDYLDGRERDFDEYSKAPAQVRVNFD